MMNKRITGAVLGALLTSGALLGASPAAAWQAGDLIFRAGAAGVLPDTDSETFGMGAEVDVDDGYSLGLTMTYMATSNIGIGLLAAWPFEHDIDGDGSLSGAGTVAEIKHLPPTLTAQYHFDTGSKFHPYVGAGVNYTYIFDEDTKGVIDGLDIEVDDSFGLAAEAGFDYELNNDWVVSGQVWYIDLDTEADIQTVAKFDVDIDPWVVMIGIGKKF